MMESTDLKLIAKIRGDRTLLKTAVYPNLDTLTAEEEAHLDDILDNSYATLQPAHRDLLCAWDDQLRLDGSTISTRKTYLQKTSYFLRNCEETDLAAIGKRAVNAFLAGYEPGNTQDTYKRSMKQFFLWYYMDHQGRREEDVPRFVYNQFKTSSHLETVDREDIPTNDEVKQLMSAALNYRDRAIVAVLADTGMRIKELRYLQRKDVTFDKAGIAVMTPTAKRGVQNPRNVMRRNRLTFSRPPVQQWYENHPRKDPDAALFCRLKQPYTDITERGLQNMFVRLLDLAELSDDRKDRLSLHKFRHLSITEDRQKSFMRDSYVAKKHGHVDTTMLRRYDHLTSDEVDRAQIEAMVHRGELPPAALEEIDGGDGDDHDLSLITCPNCGHGTAPDKALCPRCNQALDADAAEEIERAMQGVRNHLQQTGKLEEIREAMRDDSQEA